MARIYYVGDWAVMLGPVFAETPFNYAFKGTEIFNYGTWLKTALESGGEHEVMSVPSWDFYRLAPGHFEQVLDDFDVLIFSDVESKNFQLSPAFFDRRRFGATPLSYPDRIRLLVEAIHRGKHVMFMGGWLSFTGELGKAGWGRTGLREVLPVVCREYDDLRESTEGFRGRVRVRDHPILEGIHLEKMPPILGYNVVKLRPGCEVLATWEETDDPLLAVGEFGKGRVVAYTSDPAPHWGCNFVYWDQYPRLWENTVRWLLGMAGRTGV